MKNTHTTFLHFSHLHLSHFCLSPFWLLWSLILSVALPASSHPSWKDHANETYEVFGFYETPELTEWMRFISQELIDGVNREKIFNGEGGQKVGFYDYLKFKFPEFKCKHRVLFHWGYNSRPWNDILQHKVEKLHWSEAKIKEFQTEITNEQRRRNAKANAMTEDLFGFAHGGREATMARALISIAYDVHLLDDYTPDNKELKGLSPISSVIGDLINNLRALDQEGTKGLVKSIQAISRKNIEEPLMAQEILTELKSNLRGILRKHSDSRISRLIRQEGYGRLIKSSN